MAPKAKRTSEKVAADLASMTDAEIAARKAELRAVLAAKGDAHAARSSAPAAPEADDPSRAPPSEPAVRLKTFEEIMAEKRARREAEAVAEGPRPRPRPARTAWIVAPSAQPRRGPQAPRGAKAQAARARGGRRARRRRG